MTATAEPFRIFDPATRHLILLAADSLDRLNASQWADDGDGETGPRPYIVTPSPIAALDEIIPDSFAAIDEENRPYRMAPRGGFA